MTGPTVVPAGADPAPPPDATQPGSVLAQLRERAKAQQQQRTVDLPVGGSFGDQLRIRYSPMPIAELDKFGALMDQGTIGVSTLSMDLMVRTVQTVLWVDESGEETDLRVGLDGALWELLGWPLPAEGMSAEDVSPREVVDALFGGNGMQLAGHLGQLWTWMQEGVELGEAQAAS